MKIFVPLVAALLLASFSVPAENHRDDQGWSWGGDLAAVKLDKQQAKKQGVSTSAYVLGADAHYLQNGWISTFSLQYLVYSDHRKFKQQVIGGGWHDDDEISTKSSDANVVIISGATGMLWRLGVNQDFLVTAQLGYSGVVGSERTIELCSDCRSEKIDIDGGLFVKAAIKKDLGPVLIGLTAAQYLSDQGLDNIIALSVHSRF